MLDSVFLLAAIVGGTVMVCQFLMTLVGMDDGGGHGGMDHGGHGGFDDAGHGADHGGADHHDTSLSTAADGSVQHPDSSWLFGVLSFRTLVAAAAFFGIAGKAALASGLNQGVALLIALGVGVSAMYGTYWILRAIAGLASSGNERISSALGRRATVYIPIPAEGKGAGKVQLSMQNRIVEFQAVTDELERLKTGEAVEVVAITGSDVVRVRRVVAPVEV